jgi:uncharacterized protein YciI
MAASSGSTILAVGFLLCVTATTGGAQQAPPLAAGPAAVPETTVPTANAYYTVSFELNPAFEASELAARPVLQGHFEYQRRLVAAGHAARAPVGGSALGGVIVVRAASLAAARSLVAADPAVAEGLLRATITALSEPTGALTRFIDRGAAAVGEPSGPEAVAEQALCCQESAEKSPSPRDRSPLTLLPASNPQYRGGFEPGLLGPTMDGCFTEIPFP